MSSTPMHTATQPPLAAEVGATRRAAAVAMLVGATLVYLVGFTQMPAVHNGAHDARHAAALPCH